MSGDKESQRQALIDSLKDISSEKMDEMLGSREVDHEAIERPDFVWHFLLQSFATMGNARGWGGLIGNRDNYRRVTFEALSGLDSTERLKTLDEVLRTAKVRMPGKKAISLNYNYEIIVKIGGLEEAETFLHFRGADDDWRVRETTCGELVSVLYGPCKDVEQISLDPLPEIVEEFVGLSRKAFVEALLGSDTSSAVGEPHMLGVAS